jgi:DNA recombination protein Rad52
MTLTSVQVKALAGKLSFKHVKTRRTANGQTLSYIEGWHAIAEANRIFGFEAWDRCTISLECVWQGKRQAHHVCSYVARVRISVRAGEITVCREGCGSGHGIALMPGEAHESAVKEAETDAMKRALATFGNPFGLALYDKEQRGVRGGIRGPEKDRRVEWVVLSSGGQPLSTHPDPVDWCTAMRQQIESIAEAEALKTMWTRNAAILEMLRQNRPDLRTGDGRHFADILTAQFQSRVDKHATASQPSNGAEESPPVHSAEAMPVRPRRIRNQDHLKFVGSRPCLVCGRAPSQPHHIRFAQLRALGSKVGDQWTVPLCNTHHRALHNVGNEEEWWSAHGINPIGEAERLWQAKKNHSTGMRAR